MTEHTPDTPDAVNSGIDLLAAPADPADVPEWVGGEGITTLVADQLLDVAGDDEAAEYVETDDGRQDRDDEASAGPQVQTLVGPTTRRGAASVAWAAGQVHDRSENWKGMCLRFVRSALTVPARFYDAEEAYFQSGHKRGTTSTPPVGTPVFWTNGRHGHVALSAGGGYVYSNDILRTGHIDRVSIAYITRNWGQTYRGWSEDINGVRVWTPPKPPSITKFIRPENSHGQPVMSLVALQHAATDTTLSGWYWMYRRQAVASLKRLGCLPVGAPDTAFAQGWLTFEHRIRRNPPNGMPDRFSLSYFAKRCGYREPDNSAKSGAPWIKPDWTWN